MSSNWNMKLRTSTCLRPPRGTLRVPRLAVALALLSVVVLSPPALAKRLNVVSELKVEQEGSRTLLKLRCSSKPMFSVFKLERPPRLTIDLANSQLSRVTRLLDVDSWAVSQVATTEFRTNASTIVRVMVNFRRRSHYTVRNKGGYLVVTIIPHKRPPRGKRSKAGAEMARQLAKARQQAAKARLEAKLAKRLADSAKNKAHKLAKQAAHAREAEITARGKATARRRAAEAALRAAAKARSEAAAAKQQISKWRAAATAARAESERQRRKVAKQTAALHQARSALVKHTRELKIARASAKRLSDSLGRARRRADARAAQVKKLSQAVARARSAARKNNGRREQQRLRAAERALRQALAAARKARAERGRVAHKLARAEARRKSAERARRTAESLRQQAERERRVAVAARERAERQRKIELRRRRAAEKAQRKALARARTLARAVAAVKSRRSRLERADVRAKRLERALARAIARERAQQQRVRKTQQQLAKSRQKSRAAELKQQQLKRAVARAARERAALGAKLRRLRRAVQHQRGRADRASSLVRQLHRAARQARRKVAATRGAGARKARAELAAVERRLKRAVAARRKVASEHREALTALETALKQRGKARKELAAAGRQLRQLSRQTQKTERELLRTRGRLKRQRRMLGQLAKRRQGEEAARAAAVQARKSEERRLKQAEASRRQAVKEREAARKALARLRLQVAAAKKARRAEEARLAQIKRARARLARIEAKRRRLARGRSVAKKRQLARRARRLRRRLRALKRARAAAARRAALRKRRAPRQKRRVVLAPKVRNIRFVDKQDRAEVRIEVGGNVQPRLQRSGKTLKLTLLGVQLPRLLQRTLDTSAFSGPVKSVSSFELSDAKHGKKVRVEVELGRKATQQRLRRRGRYLVWEFPKAKFAAGGRGGSPRRGAKGSTHSYRTLKVAGVRAGARRIRGGGPSGSRSRTVKGARYKRRRYYGRRIDLDFKDADIHNILRLLAQVGNINIVTSDVVSGKVTIRMKNVPWDQAMDVILRAKGLGQVREGNLVRVAPLADLEKEREAELARQKQVMLLRPLETRLIPLSYADAQSILSKLQYTLSERGKLTHDARTNMIIARDVAANLNLLERMVRNLDTQTPQVMIEARVVEARTNYTKQLGIQWGGAVVASSATGNATGLAFPNQIGLGGGTTDGNTPTEGLLLGSAANPNFVVNMPASTGLASGAALGLTLGSISGTFNVNLRLSAAESTGDIRIISSPRITTLDNVEAKIEQGVTIPFSQVSAAGVQTTFKDAKLSLNVKPHVTADGSVIMKIKIERNEPDFVNTGPRGDPTILKKQAETEMLVKDGDTAVIGGVYVTRDGRAWSKVPWLAEIPIIGWFFKQRRDTSDREEVLVFITPRIINRAQSIGR